MKKIIPVIGLSLLTSGVFAEPLKGEAELAFVNTSGNSETETLNAKLGLQKQNESWLHAAALGALKSKSDDVTTAEKFNLGLQSDLALGERSSFFVIGSYEDDKFSGFDYQASVGVGYGYKVIDNDVRKLKLEIGPGYRVSAAEDGDDVEEGTVRLGEIYSMKFSETAEFNQYLTIEAGEDSTISKVGASVKSALTGSLALKIGFDIKHTDEVPDGVKKTDRETYAAITYAF